MYRLMVHDRNTMGGIIATVQHFNQHPTAYKEKNQRMEFAIAMGTEPVTALMSATNLPEHISEADVIGGLRGEPLSLAHCKTVDLLVPATSEIVIEGYLDPNELRNEGPFLGSHRRLRVHLGVKTLGIICRPSRGRNVNDASRVEGLQRRIK